MSSPRMSARRRMYLVVMLIIFCLSASSTWMGITPNTGGDVNWNSKPFTPK